MHWMWKTRNFEKQLPWTLCGKCMNVRCWLWLWNVWFFANILSQLGQLNGPWWSWNFLIANLLYLLRIWQNHKHWSSGFLFFFWVNHLWVEKPFQLHLLHISNGNLACCFIYSYEFLKWIQVLFSNIDVKMNPVSFFLCPILYLTWSTIKVSQPYSLLYLLKTILYYT